MMEKITVIVPVYNVEKYLKKCLESIRNQTYRDLEIICINDGSRDHSLEICKEAAEKDSRIIILDQENKGLAAVRNRGIKRQPEIIWLLWIVTILLMMIILKNYIIVLYRTVQIFRLQM